MSNQAYIKRGPGYPSRSLLVARLSLAVAWQE
jgi:hypothetical protein